MSLSVLFLTYYGRVRGFAADSHFGREIDWRKPIIASMYYVVPSGPPSYMQPSRYANVGGLNQ